ncbi:MAG: LacI family DNA-binding transcriptional regulator [Rhodospirillaceae bacterium]|nr:LacI family DNA-binding transcriptional regulator [Rhodospirillaceae bacterium]
MSRGEHSTTRRKVPTIREIAREAGVSTATVSRVANRPEQVSRRTREQVLAVIERHHYVLDGIAVGLASRRSGLLGLVIPTITNSIYAASTQAVQKAAQAAGYTVLLAVSEFSAAQEARQILKLIERRVEGLILTGTQRDREIYEKLERNHVPYVVTWKLARRSGMPAVSFDNRRAAATATEHLIRLGHRRIALIVGRTDVNDRARDRREGFEATLRRHGLTPDPTLIHERDFEFEDGRAAMHALLAGPRPPTAVFCANDIQAIGALYECQSAGLNVPRDISIVGFDDLPVAQYTTPQLTTIRVPASDMGRLATETLIRVIREGKRPRTRELPIELVVRGSTAPPRRGGG